MLALRRDDVDVEAKSLRTDESLVATNEGAASTERALGRNCRLAEWRPRRSATCIRSADELLAVDEAAISKKECGRFRFAIAERLMSVRAGEMGSAQGGQ